MEQQFNEGNLLYKMRENYEYLFKGCTRTACTVLIQRQGKN